MLKYVKFLIVFMFLACLSVNADTTYIKGQITKNTSGVAVRACASTDCNYLLNDTGGKISISYPESFEIIGEEGNFYLINLQYTGFWYKGYISKGTDSKSYVDKEEYTITDDLINEFQTLGFNESYATKLAILKTIHPNWNFTPLNLNITWDEAVNGETKYISTNLIDSSNTSLRNTEDGAYVNGVWTTFEGGRWYSASKQVVKYYLDPRNFLNDGHIFMFEVLSFDANTQNEETIQSLLNSSFMKGNTFYYNEANEKIDISYAKTFLDSGTINNVSAINLVGRVLLEQGENGSALSSGDYPGYEGYYNFFNINATGKTKEDVITKGLAYAKRKEWNSPYASIIGGGKLLNDYTSVGQNTLYLQKFDLVGDTLYSHQYMQNIRAPYTESYTAYRAYVKNNLINSNFNFSIPIFKGVMPERTSLSSDYNEDSSLALLSVTGCNLMPSFTSNAYNYTCNVPLDTNKVTINAIAMASSSQIDGTGEIELLEDEKTVNIVVTSASGTKSTYQIIIKKSKDSELSPDEILAKLQINNDSGYLSGFDLGMEASNLNKLITDNYPSALSEINKEGILSTGMTLKLKNNGESTYNILIYGDSNGDGEISILDLQKIQKHILNIQTLNGAYLKASDANKDGEISILDLQKIQKHILNINKIEQ